MVMEDMNIESLAAMRCPITTKPLERAAKANVSFKASGPKRNNYKYSSALTISNTQQLWKCSETRLG